MVRFMRLNKADSVTLKSVRWMSVACCMLRVFEQYSAAGSFELIQNSETTLGICKPSDACENVQQVDARHLDDLCRRQNSCASGKS